MKFDLILTTVDKKDDVIKFFKSLINQSKNIQIRVLFADQLDNFTKVELEEFKRPNLDILYKSIEKSSLSAARNAAISLGLKSDLVAFPDDDCWYADDLLESVFELFNNNASVDAICTNVYDPSNEKYYGGRPTSDNISINHSNIFKYPISVGIFIKTESFIKAGGSFDERFSVGAFFGSGEETLLVSQLLNQGAIIKYFGSIRVYHPVIDYVENDITKFYNYALGFGFLNQLFVRDGHFIVIVYYLEIIFRSLLGFACFFRSDIKRNVYLSRLKGTIVGFFKRNGGFN